MSNDNNLRDEWDAMAEVTRRPVCALAERDEHTALRDAVAAERAAERAAVVAWLRYESELRTGTNTATAFRVAEGLSGAADDIERAEHRREDGE